MLPKETRKELLQTIGGLSSPSKMPCFGWSIPAAHCKTGAKLAKEKGTICSNCYALKFRYSFPNVKGAMQNRLDLFNKSLEEDRGESWIQSMAALLEGELFFRFFDSGDLQSFEMLDIFCQLAKRCKKTKFWLPTKEHGIVSEYIRKGGIIPKNLTVRFSAYKFDAIVSPSLLKKLGVRGCGAVSKDRIQEFKRNSQVHICNAPNQNGKCQSCRYCWNGKKQVLYVKH